MSASHALPALQALSAGEPFDSAAATYDRVFTHSAIGAAQRAQVTAVIHHRFLPGARVLELNCGTGEDALVMARRGVEVTAFDASAGMIEIANRKLRESGLTAKVRFAVLRNEFLDRIDGSFDGALSNFSGMNCCADWPAIARQLARLVKPGGHVLICVMGRACLWETLYFLFRGRPGSAFRRAFRRRVARIGAADLDIYYVSVREARRAFSSHFRLCKWRGIGILVPPSYCEALVANRSKLLRLISAFDLRLGHLPGIRCWADHVLLDFERAAE